MKCSLCKIKVDSLTFVKKEVSSECEGVKKWELELCDDCRLDMVMQLFPQMMLEADLTAMNVRRLWDRLDKLEEVMAYAKKSKKSSI